MDFNDKAAGLLADSDTRKHIGALAEILSKLILWDEDELNSAVRDYADINELKLGQVAQPLRAALTGSNVSPGIFEVMKVLDRNETLTRLNLVSTQAQ